MIDNVARTIAELDDNISHVDGQLEGGTRSIE